MNTLMVSYSTEQFPLNHLGNKTQNTYNAYVGCRRWEGYVAPHIRCTRTSLVNCFELEQNIIYYLID